MAAKNTENETTVSQNLNKPVPLNEYTKAKEGPFKDMDMQDNNTKEKEVHEDSALDALKEDDEKWLTHFLLTEFGGFSEGGFVQKELEKTQVEKERIQVKKKEKKQAVGKEHIYLYPSPAAIGTSEYDIQIEDVLDTIKKHVKTEDIGSKIVANGKLTVTENSNKPVSQNNNTKGKGKEATFKELDLQNNNSKDKEEDHENTALAALKEDDMKWLTHFLLTELDELFIASQEREKKQNVVKRILIVKKSVTNKGICKQMVMKQNQKQIVSKKQIETKQIETRQITRKQVVRRRDLYWYPLPAAVGSPEYNIRIQEVLDTIKKHIKIDDIIELPEDKEDDLPVINFSISEYFRSLGQDNTLVDSEK